MRGTRQFVENLLRQRANRPMRVDPEEDAELRTAILLRAARPGAAAPREDFVATLHQRLSAELATPSAGQQVTRRQTVVRVASVAAASAAIGVGLDHVFTPRPGARAPENQAGQPPESTLTPDVGEWRTVVTTIDLPEGGVRPFDLGSVVGFVRRSDGQVHAVSGVCTHLGCRLNLNAPAQRLDCPCHNASFAIDGQVLRHRLPITLAALPVLETREIDGQVQVFVPPPPGP